MVLRIERNYFQYSMITFIHRIYPNDPEVIIKVDVCNAFNSSDRAFSLDCINGRASRDYACGLERGMLLALLIV